MAFSIGSRHYHEMIYVRKPICSSMGFVTEKRLVTEFDGLSRNVYRIIFLMFYRFQLAENLSK